MQWEEQLMAIQFTLGRASAHVEKAMQWQIDVPMASLCKLWCPQWLQCLLLNDERTFLEHELQTLRRKNCAGSFSARPSQSGDCPHILSCSPPIGSLLNVPSESGIEHWRERVWLWSCFWRVDSGSIWISDGCILLMFFFQQDCFSSWFLPCTVGPLCHQPCHQHRRCDRRSSMPRWLDWDVTQSPDKLCEGSEWMTRMTHWIEPKAVKQIHSCESSIQMQFVQPFFNRVRARSRSGFLAVPGTCRLMFRGRGLIFGSFGTFDTIGIDWRLQD